MSFLSFKKESFMGEHLIDYRHVTINQQEHCILDEIDFHVDAGEFVYLIGKVGSGKTSLLKTFYAELEIQKGEAEVLGYNIRTIKRKHIPALRRKLGIVFQDFQLLLTVLYLKIWTSFSEPKDGRKRKNGPTVSMEVLNWSEWKPRDINCHTNYQEGNNNVSLLLVPY